MLQIWLLGQFEMKVDGKRVVLASRAAQSLLGYLMLSAGIPHRREKLAGLLWSELPEDHARRYLRHELWRIRKVLVSTVTASDYILAEELTLTFNRAADYWLDAAELEKPADDAAALTAQLALYRGELLPGLYDDWVTLERERIQAVFETKMQLLLERLLNEQRWNNVIEWSERWLAQGQTPEPAYRALMVAHAELQNTSQVALVYERCIEALRNDLGVEPSRETRALYEKLTRGESPPRAIVAPLPSILVQPSGTVTFLFSDIEGSTKLLEQLGKEYATLLAEQRDLLRETAEKYHGHEVDTQGDAFFFAFFRAADAVGFAADAQRALAAHQWAQRVTLRVRMGLHTGEPMLARTGYVGMDVHRAARIGAAGHGGQVLMSRTTRDLVENDLPRGTHLTDLGEHTLKDLRYPVHIIQLTIEDLGTEFPPLKALNTGSEPPASGEPPFKGLQFFDESDAALFFGREALVSKLVGRLQPSPLPPLPLGEGDKTLPLHPSPTGRGASAESGNFLAVVVGASGSGKSSVVRAGVIPALKRGEPLEDGALPPPDSKEWRVHVLTPTAHPLEALATVLTRESESVTATATLMDDLAKDPRSLYLFLRRRTEDEGRTITDGRPMSGDRQPSSVLRHALLVVDQFEELFTLCRDDFEREAFIDNLLTALAPERDGLVTLIITIRADFYAHLAQYPELREAVARTQEYIGPMTSDELRRAIEEPAKRGRAADGAPWELEPGLVDLILRDVGEEPGALPLLSHALLETWKRRSGHLLTLKGYHDAGGVRGAIAHTAETTYQQLSPEQQAIARGIFLRLTELGEATEDTRRRASFAELIPQGKEGLATRAVLTRLADTRLITLGENTAEVAHEALIREWSRLREWLNQDREGLKLHRQLTEAAQEWEMLERDAGALYRGARLAQAREWCQTNRERINESERTFLEASEENEKRETREREAERERELRAARELAETQSRAAKELRRRAVYLAGAFVLAVVLAGIALLFGDQARANAANAQRQERLATARELAANATGNLDIDPERSILLGLKAVEATAPDQTISPEVQEVLHRAIQKAHVEKTLTGHTDIILEVAYSSDGTRIVTSGFDGKIFVWDAQSGKPMFTVPVRMGTYMAPSFSPDGSQLATFDGDEKTLALKLWDGHTGAPLRQVPLPPPLSVADGLDAFSPDWSRVAIGAGEGPTRVYDMQTGALLLTLGDDVGAGLSVAWSPDGKQIASTIGSTVKVWDAQTGKELYSLPEYGDLVWSVAYSPDSKYLATVSKDQTGNVWDAATGKELFKIEPHSDVLDAVAFSPDGTRLAVGTDKREIILYDTANGQELDRLRGHSALIHSVAFSPDGKHLASVSDDHTGKIWSLAPSQEVNTLIIPSGTGMIALSKDGTRLLSAQQDSTIEVRDAATGKELVTLEGHTGPITSFEFSPDQSKILSASADETARVWDAVSGKELIRLKHPYKRAESAQITNAAFSSSGNLIVTGSNDGTAILWDAGTGKEQHIFETVGSIWGGSAVAFSPDDTLLAVAKGDTIGLWRIADFKETMTLQGSGGGGTFIQDLRFSRDGKRLVEASQNGIVHVWDVAAGKEVLTLTGHDGRVTGVHFSPDEMLILTDGIDATNRLWNAATGQLLLTFYDYQNASATAAFSPDGKRLVIGERPGARLYTLDTNELVQIAKSKLTRALTTEECNKYLHVEVCP